MGENLSICPVPSHYWIGLLREKNLIIFLDKATVQQTFENGGRYEQESAVRSIGLLGLHKRPDKHAVQQTFENGCRYEQETAVRSEFRYIWLPVGGIHKYVIVVV